MRPLVIYLTKDNKINLTTKQFEDYLEQAYQAGYSDGYAAGKAILQLNDVTTAPYTTTPRWTVPTAPNPYEITCEAHNDIGG